LIWDKPWSVSFNLDFSVFKTDRPHLFGWRMPPNWSFNLLFRAEAGQRYTPKTWRGENVAPVRGDVYSAIGPSKSMFNLRLNKYWNFGGRGRLTIYLEFQNILNHKNYRRVNPYTGQGYEIGDYNPEWVDSWGQDGYEVSTDSEEYAKGVVNPSYIENPRILMWGVSYSW